MHASNCPYCRRRFDDPVEARAHRLTHRLAGTTPRSRRETQR